MPGYIRERRIIMSLTYSIDHISTSVEDVSVEVSEKSVMISPSTSTDPKTGVTKSVYTLGSGDNAYPSTVTYRNVIKNTAGGPRREFSITFDTWAVVSNSVSGVDTRKPISGTVAFTAPADYTVEVADLDDMLGNLFSFCYLSVTAKVRDTTWLAALLLGATEVK
jgi:hypothetical protein